MKLGVFPKICNVVPDAQAAIPHPSAEEPPSITLQIPVAKLEIPPIGFSEIVRLNVEDIDPTLPLKLPEITIAPDIVLL